MVHNQAKGNRQNAACRADRVRLTRRDALRFLGGAAASAVASAAVLRAADAPRTGLGLVIYVLGIRRRMLRAAHPSHDLFQPQTFLEYCHGLGAGGIQVPLGVLEADACERLRATADRYGMFIEGIAAPPFEDADLPRFEAEMQTAARVGAGAIRTVIVPGRRYEQFQTLDEFQRYLDRGRRALERAAPIVERHQVRLAVENHKDQRVEERVALLRRLDSPYIGACVDVGNNLALLEDPLTVVEALVPYAFTVHLKDQAVQEYADGFLLADAPLGQGCLELKKMVSLLRQAKPGIHFSLETITRDPLRVPCLADSYWPTFLDVPAAELAAALRMVRANEADDLVQVSSLTLEQQAELELANVKHSLKYADEALTL
jgi:sugar phosphate isomerase/epimerase